MPPPARRPHERRILLLALATGLPGTLGTLILLLTGEFSARSQWTFGLLVVLAWLGFAFSVQGNVIHPLRTISNLLAALREEDFSFRARGTRGDDALAQVMFEINALADMLHEQRLGALEATALLRTVMEEINVAVFAFDDEHRLRLVNRAGERLLGRPSERLLGGTAVDLGLEEAASGDRHQILEMSFPSGSGRFEVNSGRFRQEGRPHQLLVLSNVSRALRAEERQAWQRLIRVMGHELNNSLAPIRSIAGSLESLLARPSRPDDWEEDTRSGLGVIRARAEALGRFTEAYSRLARLPPPERAPLEIAPLVRRVAGLEPRLHVDVETGPELEVEADGDQIEQLLINLVRNAVDAAQPSGGGVRLGWAAEGRRGNRELRIYVEDEGPGLPATSNLFVPFFTTKPRGTGIGLVLSRQIAEAHGGSLQLSNREGGAGCRAELRLPLEG